MHAVASLNLNLRICLNESLDDLGADWKNIASFHITFY